jgi:aspartyl-tRNA(Asn)/glutamyl-tRNA(Gln) amidotransferase subunit A
MMATDIAAEVRAGRLDPRAVAEAALEAVERLNPSLNALVSVDRAQVMADAAAAAPGVLAGVPLVVKDNIWVRGRRITQGARSFADFVAPADARAVARARAQGAVILGIGACSEMACKGVTTTPLYGATRHPMDPALGPGGSSGGNAAALAAGLAPLALGTDAGGSGRRPAAHCGVVGFKPSLGAIPYGPGFAEPFWDISVIAPMARCVTDAALLFEALAGPDPLDPASRLTLDATADPRGLRIAFAPTLGRDVAVDDDIASAVAAAVEALRTDGFAIEDAAPDWPGTADEAALMPLQAASLAAIHGTRWQADPALFDPDIGAQIEAGLRLTGADVARALEAGRSIRETMAAFLARFDLLLCPTAPCVAWPHDRLGPAEIGGRPAGPRGHAVFTPQANHARVPALSLPCGRGRAGLPAGLQIVAAFGRDRTVLAAAQAFEAALDAAGLWEPLP